MATDIRDRETRADLYEKDFHAWALEQARQLRAIQASRPSLPLDFPRLIEEIEDLARRDLRAARSQLRRLIAHLLKLECSPAGRPRRQWLNTIDDARLELADILSPSVLAIVAPMLPQLFAEARTAAVRDLLDHDGAAMAAAIPSDCPYSLDQLIDKTWYPANRHGRVDETP